MAGDLRYLPFRDGIAILRAEAPSRVLVLGEPADGDVRLIETLGGEVRTSDEKEWRDMLHAGVYLVQRKGRWEAVVVAHGKPETAPATGGWREHLPPEHLHLADARHALAEEWEDARPFLGSSPLAVDDVVRDRVTGEIGRVRRVVRTSVGHRVELDVAGTIRHYPVESLERIDGDPRDPRFWLSQPPAGAHEAALTLTWTKLRNPLTDTLYSFAASKTIFRPYQFIPALKVLSSATGRLLIADEVGLGKTIEAGIVWTELEQRATLSRTLVVVPASLTQKWQTEMRRRFDRPLERIRPVDLQRFADDLRAGHEPQLHAIISLESLRAATDVLQSLNELSPRFDLVIVDEAHALRNPAGRGSALGELLSDWADYLLFLSATPINLRTGDLYNLLRLLDEGMFQDEAVFEGQIGPNRILNDVARQVSRGTDGRAALSHLNSIVHLPFGRNVAGRPDFTRLQDVLDVPHRLAPSAVAEVKRLVAELGTLSGVLSRTRKVDVPDAKAVREPRQVHVAWNAAERELYEAVQAYHLARAMRSGAPLGFTMQMPLRMAASCLPALQRRMLRNGLADLEVDDVDDLDDGGLDDGGLDDGLDDGGDRVLAGDAGQPGPGAAGGADLGVLRRPLGHDTKLAALREALRDLRAKGIRQAMVFSTFRDTLEYLGEKLAEDVTVAVLHGGVPMGARPAILEGFRAGAFDVLLVSEIGSEGLDFEFCNVLVNYDLPWNPMRVEQRIGRLDRFGQQHEKIFILNMHVPGTIETDILERLYDRIGIFRNSIGDLEPILREELADFSQRVLDPALSPQQRKQRADEVAVAVEKKRKDLDRLTEERANLSVIDQLQVDGLTESGPSDGRYIGSSEVERLLEGLFRETGALLRAVSSPGGSFELVGSPELARLLNAVRGRERGTQFTLPVLQARLRDGEAIPVTFEAAVASRHDLELLSARHPLVEVALRRLESDGLRIKRYAAVGVVDPDVHDMSPTLVRVDIVESTGLRPSCELWATGVDAMTGAPAPDVGPAILRALATGQLRDVTTVPAVDAQKGAARLDDVVWSRFSAAEDERRRDNEALADARLEARLRSQDLKIQRAQETLQRVRDSRRERRVERLHEGRLRNLRSGREGIEAEVAQRRQFSMRLTTVAVLLVVAAGGSA